MRHKLCRSFHPWCPGVKNRCLSIYGSIDRWINSQHLQTDKGTKVTHHQQHGAENISINIFVVLAIHYNDAIMGAMVSHITSLTIVYLSVYSGADQRKHQSSASLAFDWGIHRWPVNSPYKWPVTRKIIPIDDAIMIWGPLPLAIHPK